MNDPTALPGGGPRATAPGPDAFTPAAIHGGTHRVLSTEPVWGAAGA